MISSRTRRREGADREVEVSSTAPKIGQAPTPARRRVKHLARLTCLVIASYFAVSVGFALLNADEFASALPQFIRYVLAPGALALALCLVAFFARARTVGIVTALMASVLVSLFVFEAAMTRRTYSSVAGMVSIPDAEWMRRAGLDHALPPSRTAKGLNASLGISQLQDALLGGMPNARVLLCTGNGQPIVYRADRYGFNNPDRLYDPPVDLMLVGDSFVEGICLPQESNLVSQARAVVPATIGLGHRGAGPLMELAMLGRFGPLIRPRIVVLVFFEGNDWENLETERKTGYLRQALVPGQDFGTPRPDSAVQRRSQALIAAWIAGDKPALVDVVQRTNSARNFFALSHAALAMGVAYPKAASDQPDFQSLLERARAIVRSWGGELVIFYIPQADRFQGLLRRDFVYDQVRTRVIAASRAARVPLIDVTPIVGATGSPQSLYDRGGHFSEIGARLVGRTVGAWAATGLGQPLSCADGAGRGCVRHRTD